MRTADNRPEGHSNPADPALLVLEPGMTVLLAASRPVTAPTDRLRLSHALAATHDWQRLHQLAVRHKMLPLLYWNLREHRDLVPATVLRDLEERFRANAVRVLSRAGELTTLIASLGAEGIVCVPYKGPALAVEAYGNMTLRQSIDLDVIVRRRDLARVREILRERGFSTRHHLGVGAERRMEQKLYHETFIRQDGCVLEVHWGFTDKHLGFTLALETLEARLRTISLGGVVIPALGREDLLLALCVHGAKHRWARLEWLAGVASLLRSHPAPDWPVLIDRATDIGSRRVLLLGLRLSAEVLDVVLPADVHRQVFEDATVAGLASTARRLLLTDPDRWESLDIPPADIFYLRLADRLSDRLRFLIHRLTTPSQARTWRGIGVGRFYLPLDGLLRPLGAWRLLRPVLQRMSRGRGGADETR